jgi:class 3 adenylate cyclase
LFGAERSAATGGVVVIPSTSYARSGDADIAFKVFGEGHRDLVVSLAFTSNVDVFFELSENVEFVERLMKLGRVICFDKRGTGLSERGTDFVTIEQHSDDLIAVLDAAGSGQAVLLGWFDGGAACLVTAARYPDRVQSVVASETLAVGHRTKDFPWGIRFRLQGAAMGAFLTAGWGKGVIPRGMAPESVADSRVLSWWMRLETQSASPRGAARLLEAAERIDIRSYLPRVRVPVLVLHDSSFRTLPPEAFQWLADQLPDGRCKLVQRASSDRSLLPSDDLVDEIEEFIVGTRSGGRREVATLVVTDVAGSTDAVARSGDANWRDLLTAHRDSVRHSLARFSGQEIVTTGDGFFTLFSIPSSAIRFAEEVVGDASELGLKLHVGMHSSEVVIRDSDVIGIAAHVVARVAAAAGPGEILVTETVRGLVDGSHVRFQPAGDYTLKGVPGTWPLFRLVGGSGQGASA